jgi:hypothetical protein
MAEASFRKAIRPRRGDLDRVNLGWLKLPWREAAQIE